MHLQEFLGLLQNVKGSAPNWTARCPGHDDKQNSLSISELDGKILFKCHGPCGGSKEDKAAILQAVGLTWKDFLGDGSQGSGGGSTGGEQKRRIVATYPYLNSKGELLYEVVRYEPKNFMQRRPDGSGGWLWKLEGVQRVLYHLPKLKGRETVFICEGEKDVDALHAIGIPATTNAGGAGKWLATYTTQLRWIGARRVVLFPDNDESGAKNMTAIAHDCAKQGMSAKIVRLPGLADKGDVSDFLAAHGAGAKAKLYEAVKAALPLTAAEIQKLEPKPDPNILKKRTVSELYSMPTIERRWIVERQLALGGVSLLAGKPGIGKSVIARNLAFQICRGGHWFGFQCQKGPIIYLSMDEPAEEVKDHMQKMGVSDDDPFDTIIQQPPENAMAQLYAIAKKEKPSLIVIDTLQKLIQSENINDYSEVTRRMIPIRRIAEESQAHLMLLHHTKKGMVSDAQESVLGSGALTANVEIVYVYNETEGLRTLQTTKLRGIGTVEAIPETVVEFSEITGLITKGPLKKDARAVRMQTAVIEFLMNESGPVPESEITEGVEGRKQAKQAALRKLVKEGRVERSGGGRKGNPFVYALPEGGGGYPEESGGMFIDEGF